MKMNWSSSYLDFVINKEWCLSCNPIHLCLLFFSWCNCARIRPFIWLHSATSIRQSEKQMYWIGKCIPLRLCYFWTFWMQSSATVCDLWLCNLSIQFSSRNWKINSHFRHFLYVEFNCSVFFFVLIEFQVSKGHWFQEPWIKPKWLGINLAWRRQNPIKTRLFHAQSQLYLSVFRFDLILGRRFQYDEFAISYETN